MLCGQGSAHDPGRNVAAPNPWAEGTSLEEEAQTEEPAAPVNLEGADKVCWQWELPGEEAGWHDMSAEVGTPPTRS